MRPERSFHYLVLSISAAFLFVLASFSAASAATITVTNTHDSGGGSLRAAIAAANPGDTIVFNLPSPSTITLGSVLTISNNLTIKGPGATNLFVKGDKSYQVFYVSGGTVHISGLTISDGFAASGSGGGIYNAGKLTLTNVAISGNSTIQGGGIFNNRAATLTMTNCTLSGNSGAPNGGAGGGISNRGTATLTNVTLSGNSADYGGGIWNYSADIGDVANLNNISSAPSIQII